MKKRVRIKDVAERAGVSTGTVDRVIHNRGRVASVVREKVLEVMKELGFQRNMMASALAKNTIYRVAVLLPDYNIDPYWEQPYAGVEEARKLTHLYEIEIDYYFFELLDPSDFHKKAKEMVQTAPDGILFPPLFLKEGEWLMEECHAKKIPCVIFNTNIHPSKKLSYIGQDSYQSGVLAARLLNFGMLPNTTSIILNLTKGSTNARHLIEKKEGFRNYFENNTKKEIEVFDLEFEDFNDPIKLRLFMDQLLIDYPRLSGMFFTNSRAYKAIECMDEEVIQRINIIGFDMVEKNLKYLFEDKINFLINQNPIEQGYLGIVTLYNHLILKEQIDEIQYLPLDIVVKENMQYYQKRGYTITKAFEDKRGEHL
ncbi:MAG: LacI family transcriptional regulator [Polaribacter sp.]|jgi:LacI family transcriptional regulator